MEEIENPELSVSLDEELHCSDIRLDGVEVQEEIPLTENLSPEQSFGILNAHFLWKFPPHPMIIKNHALMRIIEEKIFLKEYL